MIAGMNVVFAPVEINPFNGPDTAQARADRALLNSEGKLTLGPRNIAPEPTAPVDVQQANLTLYDGAQTMKHALERVDYDMRKQRPDIMTDVGFLYGGHVRATPEFFTSYKEDGSMEQTKRVVDKGYEERGYDYITSSAWDFTVENGQFRAYSKSVTKGQYDYVTQGDVGGGTGSWGGTGMVQAVSQDQLDVIQKTLNDNKELLKGVTQLLNGIQGTHNEVANAPHLALKDLIGNAEILAIQETGRTPDKDYRALNKAETATFYRRTAHMMDLSLQTTNNIDTYS
ncbi:MAG: hypothetical protein NT086_03600 [Proteobacteria bacterium]|nr:hypothetical protein [Pseudomonadota bacterium]